MKKLTLSSFFVALIVSSAFAHEGHGSFQGTSPLHYLTSPLHVTIFLVVAAAVIYAFYKKSIKQNR